MTAEEWKTVAPVAGPCVALLALVVSLFALGHARRTMRAQTFLAVLKAEQDIELSRWMDFIRRLDVNDYAAFLASTTAEEQRGVRSIVEYFNHLGHLVKYGYLTHKHVVRLYWASLKDIRDRLLPWWLVGFRKTQGQQWYYETFEWLVEEARRYR